VGQVVRGVEFIPSVVTPNGDGINDEMGIKYTVIQISEPRPMRVVIYDLAGSVVRVLVDREQIGGIYTEVWDGKNDAGEIVPPGNYIVLLEVKTGIGNFEKVGAIAVAY
jgi:flagellar hook assembly protein FlgD